VLRFLSDPVREYHHESGLRVSSEAPSRIGSKSGTADLERAIPTVRRILLKTRGLLSSSATLNHGELEIVGGQDSNQIPINLDDDRQLAPDVSVNGVRSPNMPNVKLIVATGRLRYRFDPFHKQQSRRQHAMKLYGGEGNNFLVGGDGQTHLRWLAVARSLGVVSPRNSIDGGGGGDLKQHFRVPPIGCGSTSTIVVDGSGNPQLHTNRTLAKSRPQSLHRRSGLSREADRAGRSSAYTPDQIRHHVRTRSARHVHTQYPRLSNTGAGARGTIVIVGSCASQGISTTSRSPAISKRLTGPWTPQSNTGACGISAGNRFR